MNALTTWLNSKQPKTIKENEYKPNHIDDAIRAKFFTTYDIKRMQRIREIKFRNA
jgi:hypothetical protein